MRFLLHVAVPNRTSKGKLLLSRKRAAPNTTTLNIDPSSDAVIVTTERNRQQQSDADQGTAIQAWGQQCSPNCGCTVRFETTIDPTDHYQITSASYHAKTIVSKRVHVTEKFPIQYENGFKTLGSFSTRNSSSFLQPIFTQPPGMNTGTLTKYVSTQQERETDRASSSCDTHSRPLLKPCHCKTLHLLAKTIVNVLPQYTLSQAQNQLEFSGSRSSSAFRYTVLKNLDLIGDDAATTYNTLDINNISQGHCYDLVEDALMACLHGYIPKPRRVYATVPPRKFAPVDDDEFQKRIGGANPVNGEKVNGVIPQHGDDDDDDNEGRSSLDPLRFVRAAKLRQKMNGSSSSFFNIYDAASFSAFMPSGKHTFSSPSLSALSSMPPFHLVMNSSHHDDGSHYPVDTLTQLNLEISSMKENDGEIMQYDSVKNNDWVSYVDEKYS